MGTCERMRDWWFCKFVITCDVGWTSGMIEDGFC